MTTAVITKPTKKTAIIKRLLALILIFTAIFICIFVIQRNTDNHSSFTDNTASKIAQEMADNKIILTSGSGRRTVADFKEPIILSHGKESKLIVHTTRLSETMSLSKEGFGGWNWTSTYQDIMFFGDAQYTVDLSQLSENDFSVNNETKTLTVRIPYAVLSPINIPDDQIKFQDVKKGWAAAKDITLTVEENAQLKVKVNNLMKAKLIDDNIIEKANADAKTVVADLLSATVHSIDPEFTVIIVQ